MLWTRAVSGQKMDRAGFVAASFLLLLVGVSCSAAESANQADVVGRTSGSDTLSGLIVPPDGGEVLHYCSRPLTLNLKVTADNAPTTDLVAGTGEIRGDEGIGRHREDHEVIYVRDGWGIGVFGRDTAQLGPGSVAFVPPNAPHRLVSTGPDPLKYFWVLAPRSSGEAFRRAASVQCDDAASEEASVGGSDPSFPTPLDAALEDAPFGGALVLPAESGERLTYCRFPLTITFKVDGESVNGTRLVAARGALRSGSEIGRHSVDEVVLITHGKGFGFVGRDTASVEPGSVVFTPAGAEHGFINEGKGTLEYLVVHGPFDAPRTRDGFRALAEGPGLWCPENQGG